MKFFLMAVFSGVRLAAGVQLARSAPARESNPEPCSLSSQLSFREDMVSDNHLGHVPTNAPWEAASIRFNDVLPFGYMNVDLVVSAVSDYYGTATGNKVFGDFMILNLNAGGSVTLKFTFVDRVTGVPVKVDPFHFTVANLGRFDDVPGGSKSFSVSGVTGYQVSDGTNITVDEGADGVSKTFSSVFEGKRGDQKPPAKSTSMSPDALANSVTLQFPATTQFQLTLNTSMGQGDREFFFTGASNLVCEERVACKTMVCPSFYKHVADSSSVFCASDVCSEQADLKSCCEPVTPEKCQTGTMISFSVETLTYANLGGFNSSLPSGIRFFDVFANSSAPIDLVIRNTSFYTQTNEPAGIVDSYLMIDILSDTAVSLAFDFVDMNGNPAVLPFPFKLGVFDFDTQPDGFGVEQVEVSGFVSYTVSENTTVKIFDEGAKAMFTATVTGTAEDNPKDPMNQTQEQLDKTVSLKFGRNTNHFDVTARVVGGFGGRRLMLSGWSEMDCPGLGSYCSVYTCPAGYVPRTEEPMLRCRGAECTDQDIDTCCMFSPGSVCDARERIQLVGDSLAHNNLGGKGPDGHLPEIIRIADVLPQSRKYIEMKVSLNGHYVVDPNKAPQNGLEGGFLKVDVLGGSVLSLNLGLFDMDSSLMEPSDFMLTVANLEAPMSVMGTGFAYFNVSGGSSLSIANTTDSHGLDFTTFTGTAHAPFPRFLPGSSMALDEVQLSRAVTFKYNSQVSAQLELAVGGGGGYRTFLIGGSSRLGCPTSLAMCNTMMCPEKYRLRVSSAALSCASSTCTEKDDTDTCCEEVGSNLRVCDPSAGLALSRENLVVSNLGGLGPDRGTHRLIYSNVFPSSSRAVDLEIKNITPYTPYDPKDSGSHRAFGSISVAANTSTDFEFRFVDQMTGRVVEDIGEYAFSLVHMQGEVNQATGLPDGLPSLKVPSATEYKLSDRTFIRSTRDNTFTATAFGAGSPPPRRPWTLSVKHLRNAVALKMNSSVFTLESHISEGAVAKRKILFTGQTNMACPNRAYCNSLSCPADMALITTANSTVCAGSVCTEIDTNTCCRYVECDEKGELDLSHVIYNNLGGQGPDKAPEEQTPHSHSIIYGNVFPQSHPPVNLVMSLYRDTEYFPYHVERNGNMASYGVVNIRSGSEVQLTFAFIDAETGTPRQMPRFFLTFSGIDQQEKDGIETVKVYNSIWAKTSKESALEFVEGEEDGLMTRAISSSRAGGTEGTITAPRALSGDILNHTVTLMMPSSERFRVAFKSQQGWTGRNLIFAGPSSLTCGRKASCAEMECDTGFRRKANPHYLECRGPHCYRDNDHSKCCEPLNMDNDAPAGASAPAHEEIQG